MNGLTKAGILIAGCLLANLTYAADGSLWGGIDAPAKPPKAAESQTTNTAATPAPYTHTGGVTINLAPVMKQPAPQLPTSIDAPLPPVPEPSAPQKSTCDIIKNTIIIRPEVMNTPQIQEQLKRTFKIIPDMDKFLVNNPDQMMNLYKDYRDQYLKKYCSK